ncbi:hypothetical protein M406DRAFT_325890 [Cryphonectria parasitica EP155]|uniref:Nucleolar 27S pre-rRNA processing Urb2/Npa2 C-terminal domain-containing protein n=1 Tax=Cryphonectria parasitica (strain ATCC 38755 / EP155) TaxID=660469 RepID=A0A9P4YCB8_CRYP1|nr:uncharacterized protein M406DRAFT_325890 [Cryphonectria parasitica EP155]KAF3770441.1 hypothetical protein M406DRAFT_325890 [Cryphonectria parasitica EP155]
MALKDQNLGLIKAVRSLDHGSAESVPDTLSNLWNLLSNSISGPFHASEELVLRWLLKNMNGTAEAAEQFRRYPLAWRIMACVFRRIPLISLAKSLADRRFISILQQTLKEISSPKSGTSSDKSADGSSSDAEMVDAETASVGRTSKKRKRSSENPFDLKKLRGSHECLRSAEALFAALNSLLARLEPVDTEVSSRIQMGAEHVKSLFCSPAKDAVDILRPILSICDLALQEESPEPFDNQASWLAAFASLWDLHLQSSSDAVEVAMSLYPAGCIVLAKMDRSKDLVLDAHVKTTWTRDLRRFFIKNMILPSRAAFLNRKDIGILKAAADVTNFMPTASCPVLFSLAVKTPHSTEDASAKREHEDWTQKAFEVLEEPMRDADPAKRNQAMKVVLDTALKSKARLSLASLRTVCRQYTTPSGKLDLELVTRVADLDVDTFLISKEGHVLLDEILQEVTDISNAELETRGETNAIAFIVSLAKGFAKGRDLSGFIKKWLEALAACLKKGADHSSIAGVWSCEAVTETVTSLLQSSINARQLLALLGWFESQGGASEPRALLVVLDAISQGITEEDFTDAVDLRIYEMASAFKLKSLDDSSKARWWHIVESTVSRATSEQVDKIWDKVEPDLKKALKKGGLEDLATSAAFRCCGSLWLANYPGGSHESEAAAMASSFLKRLEKHVQQSDPSSLKVFESPRLVDLLVKSDSGRQYLPKFFARMGTVRTTDDVHHILYNESNLNNYKYTSGLVGHAVDILSEEQNRGSSFDPTRVVSALQILLDVPHESLTREQREQIMPKMLFFSSNLQGQEPARLVALLKLCLSLMVKVMKSPTFYEGMKFADLVTIGDSIVFTFQTYVGGTTDQSMSSAYECFKLLESLASSTLKQMTSNIEKRERIYLEEACQSVNKWGTNQTVLYAHRQILLRALILALESCKTKQVAQEADPAALREACSLMLAHCLTTDDLHPRGNDSAWLNKGISTWCVLVILEQLDVVEPAVIRSRLLASKSELENLCEMLCSKGLRAGWRLKELLFNCFQDMIKEPLNLSANEALPSSNSNDCIPLCIRSDPSDIHRYIDTVLRNMNEEARNDCFKGLGGRLRDDLDITGHLLTIHRLIQAESDRLARTQSSSQFTLIAQTLHMLLDKKASTMKQWNTEITLSTVSTISAGGVTQGTDIRASPKTFESLCRLVEVIIKRHRLRIEGHFHLLITALQMLLRLLLIPVPPSSISVTPDDPAALRERQAKLFARLLTLICEPSVASVTRGQQQGLDSATDAAKRSAGQHMYLVLMSYIRLQLENPVSRAVREALQPGVYSILDITTQERRRILNEAVDGSGRAIFKEMYRRYVKFGKWSGV